MKREHLILLVVNLAAIAMCGPLFLSRLNYEFVIYVGVILCVICLVAVTIKKVDYTLGALVGLTVWSFLHLAGGLIAWGDGRIYDVILVHCSNRYPILRYDQLVHIWGFAASTLVMHSLLRHPLRTPASNRIALSIALAMAGLGVGALNEILEFVVAAIIPESGVGGYVNTSLDLCADLVGAILGLCYIRIRYWDKADVQAARAIPPG